MKYTFLIILAVASICSLGACGGNDSDHDHPHDDAASAPHAADGFASDDAEHGRAYDDDTHSHDGPGTEAFYGDDATNPSEDAVVDDNGHAHDGDKEDSASTPEDGEDEAPVEPHGHDH